MKTCILGGLLIVLAAGCNAMNGNRQFTNIGVDQGGQQVGIPSSYIDNYAKDNHVSRTEAVRHFREELLTSPPAASAETKPAPSTTMEKNSTTP
jgi:hypothetical protein